MDDVRETLVAESLQDQTAESPSSKSVSANGYDEVSGGHSSGFLGGNGRQLEALHWGWELQAA